MANIRRRSLGILVATLALSGSFSLHAQQPNEVQVSTIAFGDTEFDWGRDGVSCPTCNFWQGNSRFNWTDVDHNLWVGHVDPNTGALDPPAGNNELVDQNAYFWRTFGNGPEWAFSTQDDQVISQLVYTRYVREPKLHAFAGAAFATMTNGTWTPAFLPGAIASNGNSMDNSSRLPEASQCNTDTVPLTLFTNFTKPREAFWEDTTTAAGTAPTLTPFGSYYDGAGVRWVPCTHQLTFQGSAPPDAEGNVFQQVFWYDTDTGVIQQLTSSSYGKHTSFMFQAPEFNNDYVFFTVAAHQEIDVYQQVGNYDNGAPKFKIVNQIRSPDPAEPYINSPEPFINCTPTCQSYIFMTLSADSTQGGGHTVPNGLAVTNIDPANPMFKILVPANASPAMQRLDPEYFITANGPYLYYSLYSISPKFRILGFYYVDMGLGAPSGPCAGSSAQGGLVPACLTPPGIIAD